MLKLTGILLIVTLSACSSINQAPPENHSELVWQSHDERPEWTVNQITEDDGEGLFVGLSDFYSSERVSKDAAYLDAVTNASKYFIQVASEESELSSGGKAASSSINDPEILLKQRKILETRFAISKAAPSDWYIEQYESDDGKHFFKTFVRLRLSEEAMLASKKRAKHLINQSVN